MPPDLSCDSVLDQAGLEELAGRLGADLHPGQSVLLCGELGVGKSVFARALLRSMGVTGRMPSPGFIVDAVYPASGVEIHHIDLYRLSGSPGELLELGIAEALENPATVAVVEWGDRLPPGTAPCAVTVRLEHTGDPLLRRVVVDDRRMAGD